MDPADAAGEDKAYVSIRDSVRSRTRCRTKSLFALVGPGRVGRLRVACFLWCHPLETNNPGNHDRHGCKPNLSRELSLISIQHIGLETAT